MCMPEPPPTSLCRADDLVSVLRKSGLDRTDLKKQHFKQNITRPPVTRVGQEGAAGKAEVSASAALSGTKGHWGCAINAAAPSAALCQVDMLDHFVMAVVNVMSAIREGITKPIPARKGAARREAAPQPVPVEVTAEAEDRRAAMQAVPRRKLRRPQSLATARLVECPVALLGAAHDGAAVAGGVGAVGAAGSAEAVAGRGREEAWEEGQARGAAGAGAGRAERGGADGGGGSAQARLPIAPCNVWAQDCGQRDVWRV